MCKALDDVVQIEENESDHNTAHGIQEDDEDGIEGIAIEEGMLLKKFEIFASEKSANEERQR